MPRTKSGGTSSSSSSSSSEYSCESSSAGKSVSCEVTNPQLTADDVSEARTADGHAQALLPELAKFSFPSSSSALRCERALAWLLLEFWLGSARPLKRGSLRSNAKSRTTTSVEYRTLDVLAAPALELK